MLPLCAPSSKCREGPNVGSLFGRLSTTDSQRPRPCRRIEVGAMLPRVKALRTDVTFKAPRAEE
jgi:hypothetical protein